MIPASAIPSKEIALYYPGPMWHHDDWIKTMIFFFDGIRILLPNYLHGKPEHVHPRLPCLCERSSSSTTLSQRRSSTPTRHRSYPTR